MIFLTKFSSLFCSQKTSSICSVHKETIQAESETLKSYPSLPYFLSF